jgi:hypothetical protein
MNIQLQPRTHAMQQHARPGLRLKLSTLAATAQACSSIDIRGSSDAGSPDSQPTQHRRKAPLPDH